MMSPGILYGLFGLAALALVAVWIAVRTPREAVKPDVHGNRAGVGAQFPAATELGRLVQGGSRISALLDRGYDLAATDVEQRTSAADIVLLSLIQITRTVALANGFLSRSDAQRVLVYHRAAATTFANFKNAEVVEKALRTVQGTSEQIITPLSLVGTLSLEDAQHLCIAMIAFVREVAATEGVRHEPSLIVIKLLTTSVELAQAEADEESGDESQTSDYKIFGLKADCSDEELRTAFRIKVKSFHPDALHGVPAELAEMATAQLQSYTSAYERLTAAR